MSIRQNIRIEQALKDIDDIKCRLQALEKAYSDAAFQPSDEEEETANVPRETKRAPRRHRRAPAGGVDKRTKAYKESINSIKNTS